jgi:hypothetical protein
MNSKTDLDLIKKLVRESNGFITGHHSLEEATKKTNGDEFIASYETKTGRYFFKCETYLDFFLRIYLRTQNRFFHEIMTSERRKIYFDIDSKESTEDVKACIVKLLSAIRDEILHFDSNLNFSLEEDTILLTSSNESKQSYHLILPNHFCFRLVDLRHFVKRVVDKLEEKHRNMIDMGVYRRNQSLRMFRCMKRSDENRILIPAHLIHLEEELKQYHRERYTDEKWNQVVDMLSFTKTLITFTDREPKYIIQYPFIDIPQQKGKVNTNDKWNLKVPNGLEFDKEIEYDDKYLLLYKNTNGYHCPSCDREHIQENPYVLVYKESKQAFFKCRRT